MQDLKPSEPEKLDDKCPWLGLLTDISTFSDFPSEMNYCHRSKPVSLPSYKQQHDFCLTHQFSSCPLILDKKLKRLPDYLAKTQPDPHRKRNIFIAFVLSIIMLCSAFFFFGWSKGINSAVQSFFEDIISVPTAVDSSLFTYSTRTPTVSPSPTPTKTQTPTNALQPTKTRTPTNGIYVTLTFEAAQASLSLTVTPECNYSIDYIAYSYLSEQRILVSYTLPIDLTDYLALDANGQSANRLDLPDFKLFRNGLLIRNFGTYLHDPMNPQRLYLEFDPVAGDVYEFEFTLADGRYCSKPFTPPRNTSP